MRRNEENFKYILKKYEAARAKGGSVFMESADLLDIYDYYADSFRYDDAKEVLMRAVKLFPDDVDVIVAHAYYYKNLGEWTQAENIINKLTPDSVFHKLFYAEEALAMLDLDKSRRLIQEIISSGQELTYDTALDIAEMYYEAGYYHLAEPWLQKCNTPEYPEFTRAATSLADCLFRRGEYDAAISVMNTILDEDPYDAEAWVQLAKIQYMAQKDEEALESCDYAIAANKEFAEAYAVRFDALLRLGRLDEMWESLNKPYQQTSCSPENYLHLAYEFEQKEEFHKASEVYHLAARLYFDNNEVRDQIHRHLAHEAALQGRFDDARDLLFRNADRENYFGRFINYAALLFICKQNPQALKELRYAVSIPSSTVKDLNDLVMLLYNAECYADASDLWDLIFRHAEDEAMEHTAVLALAAYNLQREHFPALLDKAMKEDFFTCVHLLNGKINLFDEKTAMKQAKSLVKKWQEIY